MMGLTFLNTLALLGLLALPFLILLYFLKLKRPQVTVYSTLLWQKVIEDMRVNSPFQRLKRSLLLLLQLLLLLLLILALARPVSKGAGARDASVIVLLDTSASMSTQEPDGRSRFDIARAQLRDMIDNLGSNAEMMIITFNRNARERCELLANRRRLHRALNAVSLTEAGTDLRPALELARGVAEARPDSARVLLLSDGGFPDPGTVELPTEEGIEYIPIGSDQPNLAITSLDVRRDLMNPEQMQLFVSMRNFSKEPFEGTMDLFLDDAQLDSKLVKLKAEESKSKIFEATLRSGGVIRVALDVDDAMAADNRAYQVLAPPRDRRVLIVGESTYFEDRVFRAAPGIAVTSIAPSEYAGYANTDFTAVIWARVKEPRVAPTNNLYLGCVPPLEGLAAGEMLKHPPVVDWDNTHTLTRFIDFSNLLISRAQPLQLPGGAQALLTTGNGRALAGAIEHEGGGLVVVGFDPYESNWMALVSYPLFMQNCMRWFEQLRLRDRRHNVLVGGTIVAAPQEEPPVVVRPDGRREPMTRVANGEFSYADIDTAGLYRVTGLRKEGERRVAANLFDTEEADLSVRENPITETRSVRRASLADQLNKEYFRYLLIAALVLLLLEWFVYHRRIFT